MVFLAHENFPPEIILLKRKTNFLRPKVFKNVPQSPYIYENDNDEDENFLTFFFNAFRRLGSASLWSSVGTSILRGWLLSNNQHMPQNAHPKIYNTFARTSILRCLFNLPDTLPIAEYPLHAPQLSIQTPIAPKLSI